MRNKIKLIMIMVISLFILTACLKSGEKVYRSIKIYEYDGTVNILRNEKSVDIYKDIRLKSDDYVDTKQESFALLKLDDDKFIYMYENTKIQLIATNKQKTKTKINVLEGKIVAEVKNRLGEDEEFEASGSNSSMSIRGTYFGVEVSKDTESNTIKTTYSLVKGKTVVDSIEKIGSFYKGYRFSQESHTKIQISCDIDKAISPTTEIKYTPINSDPRSYSSTVNTVSSQALTDTEEIDLLSVGVKFNENNKYRVTAINADITVNNTKNKLYESTTKDTVILNKLDINGYEFKHFAVFDLNTTNIITYKDSLLDTVEYVEMADNSSLVLNSNYLVVGIYEEVLYIPGSFNSILIDNIDYALEGTKIVDYLDTLLVKTDTNQVINNKYVNFLLNDREISDNDVFENNQYELGARIEYDNENYSTPQYDLTVAPKELATFAYNDYNYNLYYDFTTSDFSITYNGEVVNDIIVDNKIIVDYFYLTTDFYSYLYFDGTDYSITESNNSKYVVFLPKNSSYANSEELMFSYFKANENKPYYIKIEF